jgi:hypothetical protein
MLKYIKIGQQAWLTFWILLYIAVIIVNAIYGTCKSCDV